MREPVAYSFPLPEQRQVLGSFTAGQVGGLATAALVAVFGIVRSHPGPAGVLAAVAWLVAVGAGLLVPVHGRPLTGWSPILGRYFLARLGGRADFRTGAPRFNNFGTTAPPRVLPHELGDLEVLAYPTRDGELGVAAERSDGLYTVALEVDPPSFLLEDATVQEELLGRWGALLARATPDRASLHRLQVLLRSGPQDGGELRDYFGQARAHDLDQASQVIRSYLQLLDTVPSTTTEHRSLLVVQLSARHAARAIRQAGGGNQGACAALAGAVAMLTRELDDLGARARSVVDARRLQGILRVAFDPEAGGDLGLLARARPEQRWGSDAPGPLATEERWDRYRTAARAWHRSFTIVLPLNQVAADWIAPLLLDSGAVTRTVAITFKGVPRHQANRRVTRALTGLRAEEQRKLRVGRLATAQDQQREDATVDRMHELAEGHGEVVYAVTITVTAPDLDSLEADCETVRHAAALAGCELRSLDGQQAQAFGWTLPLARGVD